MLTIESNKISTKNSKRPLNIEPTSSSFTIYNRKEYTHLQIDNRIGRIVFKTRAAIFLKFKIKMEKRNFS